MPLTMDRATANAEDHHRRQDWQEDTPPEPRPREDSLAAIAGTLRIGLIAVLVGTVFWVLADIVLLIFAAIMLAVLLRGLADIVSRHTPIRPIFAVLLVSLAVVLVFGGFIAWTGPQILTEGQALVGEISKFTSSFKLQYGQGVWGHWLHELMHSMMSGKTAMFGSSATSLVMGTLGSLGSGLLIVVTAIYLAVTPNLYVEGCVRLAPLHYRKRVAEILLTLSAVLRWWMVGQLVDMIVVGLLACVGLSLLHVPMALALGVLAGLLTFIPYVGAFIAGIPGVIVAFTVSPMTVLWVVGVYLACHGVEGYLVAPLVQRRTVHLPPALTVFSMAILGTIYGVFGVVIATPVTAAVMVLVREIYVSDVLGDDQRSDFIFELHKHLPRLPRAWY